MRFGRWNNSNKIQAAGCVRLTISRSSNRAKFIEPCQGPKHDKYDGGFWRNTNPFYNTRPWRYVLAALGVEHRDVNKGAQLGGKLVDFGGISKTSQKSCTIQ